MKFRARLLCSSVATFALGIVVLTGAVQAQDASGAVAVPPAAAPANLQEATGADAPSAVAPAPSSAAETPANLPLQAQSPSTATPGTDATPAIDAAAATPGGEPVTGQSATGTEAVAAAQRPAGCLLPPAGASPEEVTAFLANPAQILEDYGATTIEMSGRVHSLVGADRRTLEGVIGLLPAANPVQVAGIGAGLGRASFSCVAIDPLYASEIQARVAEVPSPAFLTAFLAATSDVQVAAIGATGSPGGATATASGLSGGGAAGPGSGGLNGDDTTPQTANTSRNVSRGISIVDGNDSNPLGSVALTITVVDERCDDSLSPSCRD